MHNSNGKPFIDIHTCTHILCGGRREEGGGRREEGGGRKVNRSETFLILIYIYKSRVKT